MSRTGVAAALLCIASLVTSGCGSRYPAETYSVKGRVVFPDGKPLEGGNIEFAPQDGAVKTSARGTIDADGRFTLTTFEEGDGAIPGKHRVLILPARRREDRSGRTSINLDGRYQSFESSGLEFTVTDDPSQNDFEIKVTPAGGRR